MKFPLPRPLLPKILVSSEDAREIGSIVKRSVDRLLAEYQEYDHHSSVDLTVWKRLQHTGHLRIYRRIRTKEAPSPLLFDDHEAQTSCTPRLVVADLAGSLEDVLYECMTPSHESVLIKSSYIGDGIADVEIIHTIKPPSFDEPFSYLVIKWMAVADSVLAKPRELLCLDAVGSRLLANGNRVGYQVTQSINLTDTEQIL